MNLSVFLLTAATGSSVATLHVEPFGGRQELVARLKAERPELRFVRTASTARYVVVVRPAGRRANLEVHHASGVRLLDRPLALSPHSDAGLRVAALLVLRAVDRPAIPERPASVSKAKVTVSPTAPVASAPRSPPRTSRASPRTTRSPPPSSGWPPRPTRSRAANGVSSRSPARPRSTIPPRRALASVVTVTSTGGGVLPASVGPWVFDIGAGMRILPQAGASQLTLRAGFAVRRPPFRWGASAALNGLCCAAGTAVRGRQVEVVVLGEADLDVVRLGPFQVGLGLGAGVRYARLTAQVQVFEGPGPEETVTNVGFEGRAFGLARASLTPRVAVAWAGGILVRAPEQVAQLPAGFSGDPLRFTWWSPWTELRLEVSPF